MSYSPLVLAVVEKIGCQVPQTFPPGESTAAVIHACDAGLCRLVPTTEGRHHLLNGDGSLGAAVVLTDRGRDENTAYLNACREGYRQPPYRSVPLQHSRIRLV